MDVLGGATAAHHRLYIEIFGVAMAKPKIHFIYHTLAMIRLTGINLSCWRPEREHKVPKASAKHLTSQFPSEHILRRSLVRLLHNMQNAFTFSIVYLVRPKLANHLRPTLLPLVPDIGLTVEEAKEIQTHIGRIREHDFIVAFVGERVVAGFAQFFVGGVCMGNGKPAYTMNIHVFQKRDNELWYASGVNTLVPIEALVHVSPFINPKGGVKPLLPMLHAI